MDSVLSELNVDIVFIQANSVSNPLSDAFRQHISRISVFDSSFIQNYSKIESQKTILRNYTISPTKMDAFGQNVTEICQPNMVLGEVNGVVCSNVPVD